MNCINCGKELKPEAKFCRYCGTPTDLVSIDEEPQPEDLVPAEDFLQPDLPATAQEIPQPIPEAPDKENPQQEKPAPVKKRAGKTAAAAAVIAASAVILAGAGGYLAVKNDIIRFASSAEKEAAAGAKQYSDSGDYEKAAEQYCAAISEAPSIEEYYQGAARAYIAMGEPEKAEEVLSKGVMNTGSATLEEQLRQVRADKPAVSENSPETIPADIRTEVVTTEQAQPETEQPPEVVELTYIPVRFVYESEKSLLDDISGDSIFYFSDNEFWTQERKLFTVRSDGSFEREQYLYYYENRDGELTHIGEDVDHSTYVSLGAGIDEFVLSGSGGYCVEGFGGGSEYTYNSHGYVSEYHSNGEGPGYSCYYFYEYDDNGEPTKIHMIECEPFSSRYFDVMSDESRYSRWKKVNVHYSFEDIPEFSGEKTDGFTVSELGYFSDVSYIERQFCFEMKNFSAVIVQDDSYYNLYYEISNGTAEKKTDDKGLTSSVTVTADNGEVTEYVYTYSFDSDGMPQAVTVTDGSSSYELKYDVQKTYCECEYDANGNPVKGTYTDAGGNIVGSAEADYVVLDENVLDNVKAYEAENGMLEENGNEVS